MKISIGFSPCPNDTFIFDAMINHRIDTLGYEFEVILADVEELNKMALNNELTVTKLSYHAYGYALKDYVLLDAGSALGKNVGPLLISKEELSIDQLIDKKIAIPGKYTTANFLLSDAFPQLTNKVAYLFSDIENAVLQEEVAAGLIIHENRFTYADKGLHKIIDLGTYWEDKTNLPIPLGGIVIKREMDEKIKQDINQLIRSSIEYAYAHPSYSLPFIRANAQEMDESVMRQHIDLYVNEYSIDLGTEGKKAVSTFINTLNKQLTTNILDRDLFLNYNNS